MSEITDKLIFELIKHHYRPYDTHEEFGRGFSALQAGNYCNPAQRRQYIRSSLAQRGGGCDTLQESDRLRWAQAFCHEQGPPPGGPFI